MVDDDHNNTIKYHNFEEDEDEDEYDDNDMLDNDPYQSSSPSINEEEIDFQYVYALRTFVATEQGQANASKGDAMILLNDSNSYWWLVRLVKDSTVGFLPAEHIETPTERLARLNKHRNGDMCSPASLSYKNDKGDLQNHSHLKNKTHKQKKNKSVKFTPTLTYVSASEYEYSDADDADIEDMGDDGFSDDEQEEYQNNNENNLQNSASSTTATATTPTTSLNNHEISENNQPPASTSFHNEPLLIKKQRSNQSLTNTTNQQQAQDLQHIITNSDEEDKDTTSAVQSDTNHAHRELHQPAISKIEYASDSSQIHRSSSWGHEEHSRKNNNTFNHNISNVSGSSNNSTNGIFSRLSRGMNRRHSALSPSETAEATQLMDSQLGDETSKRRRSLLKTRSSTDQLKKSQYSSVDSNSQSTQPSTGIVGLFKRNRRGSVSQTENNKINNNNKQSVNDNISEENNGLLNNASTHKNGHNVSSVNHSSFSSSTSTSSSISSPRLSPSPATSPEVYDRADISSENQKHGPQRENLDSLQPESKYSINNSMPLHQQPNPIMKQIEHTDNIKDFISNDNTIEPVLSSEKASSISSLPSVISDRETRSGSAATMSTIPSSPSLLEDSGDDDHHNNSTRMNATTKTAGSISKFPKRHYSFYEKSCLKLHPDIIPIYHETFVKLDEMCSRINSLLDTYS